METKNFTFLDTKIVESGEINSLEGQKIYLVNSKNEELGRLFIHNFELYNEIGDAIINLYYYHGNKIPEDKKIEFNEKNSVFSVDWFVQKEYRSLGVMTDLFKYTIDKLKKFNIEYLVGFVFCSNSRAIKLYKKIGFQFYSSDNIHYLIYYKIV